ncbi:MAG: DinB family protein [Bacteroidota bacterium]
MLSNRLLDRTQYAYSWIDKYLTDIPDDRWDDTPPKLDSNLTWQLGHLTLSAYYHSIMVIKDHQPDILQVFPLREYSKLFHRGSARAVVGTFSPASLRANWRIICARSLQIIENISPQELLEPLVEQSYPHPIATTKEEALEWNVLHNHYHWGQVGMVRRALLQAPYDYWSNSHK